MKNVLILANETIAGQKLLDAMLARKGEDVRLHVVVPKTEPKHGNVVYDEAVRDSAQVRVDLAVAFTDSAGRALRANGTTTMLRRPRAAPPA